jgi:NADH-quinone oxidoreductase subunit H
VINLQVANINVGILYLFAMASLSVYGIVIGAWASNNKFSLMGGVRGSAQMISYEIAMGLSVIGILMIYETLELQEITRAQGRLLWGWLPAWGIVLQPVAFFLFFTAAVAEFLMFFTAEFTEMVTAAALITTLFLGGWQVPFLVSDGSFTVTILQVGAFVLKVVFCCWLFILIRWTLPRFRYDQVMRLGWKMLLPLALANLVVTAIVLVAWGV